MAIFGLGAFYDGDVSDSFQSHGVACVGWNYQDAPSLHKLMRHIKVGDIIYLKSYPRTQGLIIKAIGIVLDDEVIRVQGVGEACLRVRWVWSGNEVVGMIGDKYNRIITLYEETNPAIQQRVLNLLLQNIS